MAVIKRVVGQITLSRIVDVVSTTYFYLLMPSIAAAPSKPTVSPPPTYETEGYSGWSETEPGYISGDTRSLYVTVRTIYGDGSFDYTTPSLSSSYEAAKQAYNRAQSALSLADGINNYFWWLTSSTDPDIPTGAYVTSVPRTNFEANKTGGNIAIQSTGLTIRDGTTELSSLTGLGLNFYDPNPVQGGNNLILSINNGGVLQSGNYVRGNDTKFASSGTKIDLTNGEIYTPYFRLAQGLDSVTAGAYVHGTIEALDGRIGTGYIPVGESQATNYWEIGNYTDYNLENTAKIIGHGSSFIQLGDDGTWRLATNRIHTGWHVSGDTLLHFPEYTNGISTVFWDYGMHAPESKDDKFVYIRTAANTTALSNLLYDIDDDFTTHYWNYKFWIDGEGNIYAPEIYKKKNDVWTPVDAGGSVNSATKLSSYGGAYNQPVYFPSTGDNQGKPVGITDGNGNAITIGVSVPANAKFTDTKNTAGATSSNSKLFLIGATEQTDNPQTYSRSTVYIGTDGLLYSGSKKVAVVDDISAVLKYKGTKATIANLPSSGNTTGDVWHVTANNGEYAWDGSEWQELGSTITIPANTGSSTTGITIADHSTTTIYGVQSTTTIASKVTLGTAFTIPNVTGASDVTVPKAASSATACDDITDWQPGSGSANLTFTMDTTDSKKLKITFNHAHTAPTLSYTARSITGVSGSTTASKVTLGTEFTVPNVTGNSNVTVPIKNGSNTTVVTSGTHSITDNGHIHTI